MKKTNPQILFLAMVAAATAMTGCATYKYVEFEDHPSRPLTSMQVVKTRNYLFTKKVEYQFYLCRDEGAALSCDLQCGGDTDLACPMGLNQLK